MDTFTPLEDKCAHQTVKYSVFLNRGSIFCGAGSSFLLTLCCSEMFCNHSSMIALNVKIDIKIIKGK